MHFDDANHEPIFIAATVAEAEAVEKLLESEGIDYGMRPEVFTRPFPWSVCYEGLLFEVTAGQAQQCRRILKDHGFVGGVLDPDA